MWNEQKIEKELLEKLTEECGVDRANELYADYASARNYLLDHILDRIAGAVPDLTDHSSKHIQNVLTNTYRLLGDDIHKLSAYELYCLCLIVFFHDVGNIKGRDDHNKNVVDVYNEVRKGNSKFNSEKRLVLEATKAHCGKAKDGSKDTLKDLSVSSIYGEKIRTQSLAAILRFADELAEGPQRTSDYMCKYERYSIDSMIFHKYAQSTDVFIDRGGERVVLTYDIEITQPEEDLKELLEFIYKRVIKLDEERLYNKYYSEFLLPFKRTEINFLFYENGIPIDLDLPIIKLCDQCHIPGEKQVDIDVFFANNPSYDIASILSKIKKTE